MTGIRRELSSCRARRSAAEVALTAGRAALAETIRRRRALRRAKHRAVAAELSARDKWAQKELEELHAAYTAGDRRWRRVEIVETI